MVYMAVEDIPMRVWWRRTISGSSDLDLNVRTSRRQRDFQGRARSLPSGSLQRSASDLPVNFLVSGQPLNEYRLIIYLIA